MMECFGSAMPSFLSIGRHGLVKRNVLIGQGFKVDDHLLLSLCLNGTYAHGDTIEFVERTTTDAFKGAGYVSGDILEPTLDLAAVAAGYGADWRPRRLEMAAGDGALFEPANILHRGISPAHGSRYMIEVCLVPSPAPWQEMCAYYAVPSTSADFPLVDDTWPAQVLASAEQVA